MESVLRQIALRGRCGRFPTCSANLQLIPLLHSFLLALKLLFLLTRVALMMSTSRKGRFRLELLRRDYRDLDQNLSFMQQRLEMSQ